jgi:hypothetical protein
MTLPRPWKGTVTYRPLRRSSGVASETLVWFLLGINGIELRQPAF